MTIISVFISTVGSYIPDLEHVNEESQEGVLVCSSVDF